MYNSHFVVALYGGSSKSESLDKNQKNSSICDGDNLIFTKCLFTIYMNLFFVSKYIAYFFCLPGLLSRSYHKLQCGHLLGLW